MLVLLAVHLAFTQRGEADFEGNDTGGEEINPRIINGDDADENEYPFMVRIARKPDGDHVCGGSLITSKIVLTAAHCLKYEEGTVKLEMLHIVVGDHSDEEDTHEQVVEAMRIIIHEDYYVDPTGIPINDIALIVLKEEITLTAEINVVTMPTAAAQYDTGTTVTVIGWGVIEDEGDIETLAIADKLQELEYTMTADEVCFNYWVQYAKEHDNHGAVDYNAEEEIKMLTGTTKCAIDANKAAGSFKGDSGGPIFIKTGPSFIQLGIVSWGHWDPKVRTYEPMTNVFHYDSWITEKKTEAEKTSWLELHTGGAHGLVTIQDKSTEKIYTICNDGITMNEIKAICKNQGYNYGVLGDVRDYLPDKRRQMEGAYQSLPPFGFTNLECDDGATHVIDECTMDKYEDTEMPCFNGEQLAVKCYNTKWVLDVTHVYPNIKESREGDMYRGRVGCEVKAEKNGVSLDMRSEVSTWLVLRADSGVEDLTEMRYKKNLKFYVGKIKASDELDTKCIACVAFIPGTEFYAVAELEGESCPEITDDQYKDWVGSHEEEDGGQ